MQDVVAAVSASSGDDDSEDEEPFSFLDGGDHCPTCHRDITDCPCGGCTGVATCWTCSAERIVQEMEIDKNTQWVNMNLCARGYALGKRRMGW